MDVLPERALDAGGAPYFPARPDIRFSLSHTRGFALCAVSRSRVGCDAQLIAEKDLAFAERLATARERADFTLHELWCLRESVYKLAGGGDLRRMRFRREGGVIIPPVAGAVCRLYGCIPGCAAAAASFAPDAPPETMEPVDSRALLL